MALTRGTKLGTYEVTGPIGSGGMGEVYRARDTRLQRDVALKVLPDLVSTEPDRLARLQREAQALASLNHPNIAQIHGLEESGGVRALVMELVEGDDLSTVIARGPMPFADARPIARQIAEALETAHEQGIVHRDLKPANVKVRPDGTVKVLDFGLAKITDPLASASGSHGSDLALSPTLTAQATRAGMILGTAAYMSPEQARGRAVDRRADIWAFGVVLYEMLTGRRAFEGEDVTITLANVLKEDVDWRALPADLPPAARRLLRRCLEKDPRRRLASMGDARLELDDVESGAALDSGAGVATAVPASRNRGVTIALGLAVAAGAALLTAGLMRALTPTPVSATKDVTRLAIALPEGEEVTETNRLPLALSPDGTMLAYVGRREEGARQLYLKRFTDRDAVALPGTEGAASPFFSPDGRWIAFFAGTKLKKIAVGGAALQVVTGDVPDPRGGTWGPDGQIYFTPTNTSSLYKVAASGGTATPFTELNQGQDEISHRWPLALPDGKTILFTLWTGPGSDERRIVMQSIATGERHALVPGGDSARYLPSGFLVYGRLDDSFAIPWQPTVADLGGAVPITLPEHPRLENEGGAAYDLSPDGTFVYLPGGPARYAQRVVWVDRDGRTEALPISERDLGSAVLSPDGRQAAVQVNAGTIGIWLYDFDRKTFTPFVTGPGSSQAPLWTPDGTRLIYRGTRNGTRDIYIKAADGTGSETRLTTGEGRSLTPTSMSPDGQWLIFNGIAGRSGADNLIWKLRLDGRSRPEAMLDLAERLVDGQVSPDGRWMAYASAISARQEIYVTPFPGPGPSRQVSVGGGYEPLWSRDGRELFFQNGTRLMVADIAPGPAFKAGPPRVLYEGRFRGTVNGNTPWSVSSDGKRFLRVQQAQPDGPIDRIDIVLGWGDQLKRLAAAR